MAAVVVVNNNQQISSSRHMLTEAERYLTDDPDNDTPDNGDSDKQSPETSVPFRACSDFSMVTSSASSNKDVSRSYKLAQLEQALRTAKLLKTVDDRTQFDNECLIAIRENDFDRFERQYYKKLHDHYEKIKREEETKKIRRFAFVDFEKNYMELYPARDITIKFLDASKTTAGTRVTNSRSASAHPKSAAFAAWKEEAVDLFYADCSRRHLRHDSKRTRDEVEKFARRAMRTLAESIPAVSQPPQRVRVEDKRDTSGKPNERVLLETNHKRAMSAITKRRHLVIKMMTQTKKNQLKIGQQWKRRPIGVDNPTCYREILERTDQFEEEFRDKLPTRPTTAMPSRRLPLKSHSFTAAPDVPQSRANTAPTLSLCVTPFQDSLSVFEMESTKKVRVLLPTRPLTAPTKSEWVNYC